MNIDPNATKYMIKAKITADGIVEKPDVVGAIFGQTEGLLGEDLDLRDLQKTGRIGRIEVEVVSKGGKSEGIVYVSSSLDQVETVLIASSLETIDRVGPCKANIRVLGIEDVRVIKREKVVERAKELLNDMISQSKGSSADLTLSIRQSIQVEEITTYGKDKCPAGPGIKDSESLIIVEGRSDVLNLLKAGIKNAIAVEGTNIPQTVRDLSREKVTTAFVDGDRGGELILRELFQTSEIDFVARAPRAHEVEELSSKQLVKCLRNKVPGDQYMEMNGLVTEEKELSSNDEERSKVREAREPRDDRNNKRDRNEKGLRREREQDEQESRKGRGHDRHDDDSKKGQGRDRFNSNNVEKFRKKTEEPAKEEPSEEADVESDEPKEERPRKGRAPRSNDDDNKKQAAGRSLRGKKDRNTKTLSPEQEAFRDMLLDMSSTHNAKLLSEDNSVIKEIAVKNLVNSLKDGVESISSIVFDGVISQRILDVSIEKGIRTIVGTRKGNITKMPADVAIFTKEDLY
ncbi:DNA primase DnaG [Candidatus Methanoplasma termitum]|uniref:DNA primase DnaG n=1 Tax=Candidatus Methanoplasma termitum TaxID=1577791 RepID=A0A0A7LC47_9ARCH|nr:DNA primase DnaG [Candidatus Methanoplasma termitum]AIZ56609.1 DNA primase DnaG [Candidatus Methanoplasma termitum]MCL2334088.1 DNA primase DnaG [Candidatus Methanoplasma sp.]